MAKSFTWSPWLLAAASFVMGAGCGQERPNVAPDTSPPEVVVSEVPLFTRAPSLMLEVKASDAMGVKHVWYMVNNGSPVELTVGAPEREGALSVVSGRCEPALAANSANVVAIWAEDYAGNSGASGQPPYMKAVTVVHDDAALGVSLSGAAPATYYDESKMTVGTAVPPVYDRHDIGLEVVAPGETIHKAATRLAPRSRSTSAADLEGANPDNLPWLPFAVSLTGSPIRAATYTIRATAGSTTREYSGDLLPWRSPQSSAAAMTGTVYFNLPLDAERIPMLTSAPGVVTLKVTVDVTDEAENRGGDEVELRYAVIGPPLNIAVDALYPTRLEANSTHHYTIVGQEYEKLFDGDDLATFGPTQQVRLVRLVVTNPASQPVALDVSSLTGSWSMTETWTGDRRAGENVVFNDSSCPADTRPATHHATMWASVSDKSPIEHEAPEADRFGSNQVVATSSLSSLADPGDGVVVARAGPRYIVPPADGSAPGVIALYVARPLTAGRVGVPALGAAPYTSDVGTFYTYASERRASSGCCVQGFLRGTYYKCKHRTGWFQACSLDLCEHSQMNEIGRGSYCGPDPVSCPLEDGRWLGDNNIPARCRNCRGTCSCSEWLQAQTYNTYVYFQRLSAASETLAGTLTPVTQPVDGEGNVYGIANREAAGVAITGSFTH